MMMNKIKIEEYIHLDYGVNYSIFKCTICDNWNITGFDILNSEQLELVEDHIAICGEDNGSN
jgi:hypothetical protein